MTTQDRETLRPLEALEVQCEWRTDELGDRFIFDLTDDHLAELDAALVNAESQVTDVLDIEQTHFPLPTLGPELARITENLVNGDGLALIRGVPVEHYGKERSATIYWGIGTHLGLPWPQNVRGHLLGDVTDQGRSVDDPTSRGNEIGGVRFPFHSDGSDLVGLFCLDSGASGGESLVANALAIHNDLVRDAPELAAAMYEPLPYDRRGEEAPGAKPWYTMPAWNRQDDRLFVRYIRPYITSCKRHADAPGLTDVMKEAMNTVDEMCDDPTYHVSMTMAPGDMQFVNNYHMLHARRSYTDDRESGKIRHLKRLWLETNLLTNAQKPKVFRLGLTDSYWSSKGKTKSQLVV